MTAKDFTKEFKQLIEKPAKLKKYLKHNEPKRVKFGMTPQQCKLCKRKGAHVGKYGLTLCRQCFRENAQKIGFKKYS